MLGGLRAGLDGRTLRVGPPIDPAYDSGEGQDALERRYVAQSAPLENAVFFESFYGRNASCNPLAIDRELAARTTGLTRYWSVVDFSVAVPDGAVAVVEGSPEWWRARGASRLIVVNDWLRRRYSRRPGQRVLQTWHGTPLKRLALHRPGFDPRRAAAVVKESRRWDVLLAQNPYAAGILRKAYAFLTRPIWVEGYPRNDVLSTGDGSATRAALGIGADERVLLYAPTWRDDRSEIVDFVDPAALAADDRRRRARARALAHAAAGTRHRRTPRDRRHGLPRHLAAAAGRRCADHRLLVGHVRLLGHRQADVLPRARHGALPRRAAGLLLRPRCARTGSGRAHAGRARGGARAPTIPRRTRRPMRRGAASSTPGMTATPPSASCRACSTRASSTADDPWDLPANGSRPLPTAIACGHVPSNPRTRHRRHRPDRAARRPRGERRLRRGPPPGRGAWEDLIDLPDGFQPEGIAIDRRGTAYFGSLSDGDIYAADLRTGEGAILSEGPGSPSVGLKVDRSGRLFVSGGPSGTARVVDTATGDVLASYQLTTGPAFINDVVLTRDGAWFTNSQAAELYFLPVAPSGTLPGSADVVTLPLTGEWVQQPGFNANGIAETPDHRALLVIQSSTSTLFRVDPSTGAATAVELDGPPLTFGDGLLVQGRTLYVVQNRLGQVAVIRLDADGTSGSLVDTLKSEAFDVPTTVAAYGSSLFLPNARFGSPPPVGTPDDVVRITR